MDTLFDSQGFWKLGLVVVVAVFSFFGLIKSSKFSLLFIGAMLFISGLGLGEDVQKGVEYHTWLFPLQSNRQAVYMACAGMVLLGGMIHAAKLKTSNIPGLGIGMMLMGVYMGTITIFHTGMINGFAAIVLALFSMSAVMIVLASQLREWDDFVSMLRVLALIGCVWTLACVVQFVVDKSALTTGFGLRRFIGLSGNPQHAAGLSAVMATLSFWLVLNDRSKLWKLLAVMAATTHIVFVLWTASRTGLALTMIGFTGILYARLGRAVFFAPVAGLIGYAVLTLAQNMGVEFGFERLTSSDDTRSDKWNILIERGFSSPIVGVGLEDAGGSENGFLYGFASFGFGVPIILTLIMLATMVVCAKLVKARFETPNPVGKRVIDLTLAFFAMYWAGNMFEGFGVARISPQLTYFLIFSCFASCAIALARDEHAWEAEARNDVAPEEEYFPQPIRL
ncbi:MAG: hypothetical protein NTV94_12140 [Planctomycetota bacterium]|nr:hypothetical protein [Planctomycetota bacterium]